MGLISGTSSATLDEIINLLKNELPGALDEFKDSVGRSIATKITQKAKQLARSDLPSGGGNYPDSIETSSVDEGDTLVWKVYSSHPWAMAIENGTKAHVIDAKSGGLSSQAVVNTMEKELGILMTKEQLREIRGKLTYSSQIYKEGGTIKGHGSQFSYTGEKKQPLSGSYGVLTSEISVSRNQMNVSLNDNGRVVGIGGKRKPQSRKETQGIVTHELMHKAIADYQFKRFLDNRGGLNLSANKEEKVAYAAEAELKDLYTRGGMKEKATMTITNVLPSKGQGSGLSPSPAFGTKYNNLGDKPIFATTVNHPGARSFRIFARSVEELSQPGNGIDDSIAEGLRKIGF